jgi:hypothetical protein
VIDKRRPAEAQPITASTIALATQQALKALRMAGRKNANRRYVPFAPLTGDLAARARQSVTTA